MSTYCFVAHTSDDRRGYCVSINLSDMESEPMSTHSRVLRLSLVYARRQKIVSGEFETTFSFIFAVATRACVRTGIFPVLHSRLYFTWLSGRMYRVLRMRRESVGADRTAADLPES
jgi:hypothetical protein